MENFMSHTKEKLLSDANAREYCFAKELRCDFWDSMSSQIVDKDNLDILEKVLDFIEHDY